MKIANIALRYATDYVSDDERPVNEGHPLVDIIGQAINEACNGLIVENLTLKARLRPPSPEVQEAMDIIRRAGEFLKGYKREVSLGQLETAILSELRYVSGRKSLRQEDILEWSLTPIDPHENEIVYHLPVLGVYCAVRSDVFG